MEMQKNDTLNPDLKQLPPQGIADNPTTPLPHNPRPRFALKKGDAAFAVCAIILSIFAAVSGIFGGFALGYLISSVLMTVLFIIYFARCGKARFLPVVCGILALACSAIFVCTTNVSVRFFGVITGFLLALICFDGLANGSAKGNRKTLGVFYSAASTVGNIDIAVKSLLSYGKGDKKAVGKALLGLVCAIPVLLIVVPLLISSDDAFRGMMNDIFSNTFETVFKAVFGIILSVFAVSYGFSLKADRVSKIKNGSFKGIESVYIISFLSAISLCYLLYLFSQLAYFFSAFKGFLPEGDITYAQYARKGFFEMCVITVINLVIVFTALLIAKKKNGKVSHGIKALSTFITVFTLIIIATAISKMVLYIGEYGMTVPRLTTSAFMLFLSIVFISVILRIYTAKINIIKTAVIAAGCIILILGTVNVNSVCAKYNYESYVSGKLEEIDVQALYELGPEGIPYVVKIAQSNDAALAEVADDYLSQCIMLDYFEGMHESDYFTVDDLKKNRKNPGFSSFSIPANAAYDAFYEYIEETPGFCYICQEYYERNSTEYSIW